MALPGTQRDSAVFTAMICAGAVSAQFIAGKATRDALYLAHLDVTSLPAMVVATALFSIGLLAISSRGLRTLSPRAFVPAAFAVSAVLLLGSWALLGFAPTLAAQAVYLQISGLGPMLGSGFWLIATERFDPHTARQNFGRIAGFGTLCGLGGALVAERVAAMYGVTMMLPVLAALNLLCAWQIRRLVEQQSARPRKPSDAAAAAEKGTDIVAIERDSGLAAESPRSGLHALAH